MTWFQSFAFKWVNELRRYAEVSSYGGVEKMKTEVKAKQVVYQSPRWWGAEHVECS
jgi:hypothetical protein